MAITLSDIYVSTVSSYYSRYVVTVYSTVSTEPEHLVSRDCWPQFISINLPSVSLTKRIELLCISSTFWEFDTVVTCSTIYRGSVARFSTSIFFMNRTHLDP